MVMGTGPMYSSKSRPKSDPANYITDKERRTATKVGDSDLMMGNLDDNQDYIADIIIFLQNSNQYR